MQIERLPSEAEPEPTSGGRQKFGSILGAHNDMPAYLANF